MLIPDGMPPGTDAAAGVIGYPVRHSLSPAICQAALDHLGLDWIYAAFEVPAGQAGRALDHMRARGMVGLSVTMPHKADVADAVDGLSPAAAALGAVNCVARDHDRLIGHNTDGAGFCDALLAEGVDPAGIRCAVLGAGGAARAVVAELARRGAAEVAVIARRPDRAESAAGLAGPVGTTARPNSIGRYHLVVNATPVGMAGTEGAGALPLDPDLLTSTHHVAELVYNPLQTPLLVECRTRGVPASTGVGMLVHQAAHAVRIWTGAEPPVEAMSAAAITALERRKHQDVAITALERREHQD
ncbi:shikimate dehydrogenase [Candidatus Poriferisocius sp.]|uniref:shikimate dehydrogenase n=1 Tax=Candidatus Poriferisocius sp. TaxID=3101276 RepID=UPI003B01AC68